MPHSLFAADRWRISLAAILLLLPLHSGQAATTTAVMPVSATVLAACTVAAQPLAFGSYQGAQIDATTTIGVSCTNGTAFNIGLDLGSNPLTGSRRMLGPAAGQYLAYSLSRDTGHSLPWGSSVGTDTLQATSVGSLSSIQVYGRVNGGQYPAPGTYADSVTITVTY